MRNILCCHGLSFIVIMHSDGSKWLKDMEARILIFTLSLYW
ncbi:hydrogenase [Escherichia coli]|nr:hydrogenase [Escherichia coli O69:H11 str. 07-3763]KDV67835.1 hydrogenase [Escherichia coli O26:H11 str. 2011C-3274]KDV73497.1 hydrogenase [Escherichia coli O118:H16 str. 07-4255]OKT62035.1 hydrogenase [Escherichia coli]OKT78869.1 hydrogenase [Escherichia coli]